MRYILKIMRLDEKLTVRNEGEKKTKDPLLAWVEVDGWWCYHEITLRG
jgi:hypothetical protein